MAQGSKIEWTNDTWNPWHGCKKVSKGCKYCYMYRDKERFNQVPTNVIRSVANFKYPLSVKDAKMIFTCSWSDWFIEEADDWRQEAWEIIKRTPKHTYQILTKRPERIVEHLPKDWGDGYPNVWLGISAENQETFDKRMAFFREVKAAIKFISAEPLLDRITLRYEENNGHIDWVIVGGESGNDSGKYIYRPMETNWGIRLANECVNHKIPLFVKQMGTYIAKTQGLKDRHGRDIREFPEALQIRQFPKHYGAENKA